MNRTSLVLGGLTLAASLATGCNNGPPGGGLTNGPPPDLTAQKPAMRTDMPEANRTNTGEMKGAAGTAGSESAGTASNPIDGTASSPGSSASTGSNAGTGGKGSGAGGNEPAKDPAPRSGDDRKDTPVATGSASAQPPSDKVGTAPGGAAGATKPAGDIKVGTPKSPQ